tara:strand:- start:108 stop:728 length:621 start_codon:yes stop_codon:yes gene_type:complete
MIKTSQEKFWIGNFGNKYIRRNKKSLYLSRKKNLFKFALKKVKKINSCIELGAGIGTNIICLKKRFPKADFSALEINKLASKKLKKIIKKNNIINRSVLKWRPKNKYDLVLTCGFLIHIEPKKLQKLYKLIIKSSKKYILICEYYDPKPQVLNYRGYKNKLFKRDFAGELIKKYKNLKLIDYGFVYRNDPWYPLDDLSWFLLKKKN